MEFTEKIENELVKGTFFHAYLLIAFTDDERLEIKKLFAKHFDLRDYNFISVEPLEDNLGKKGEVKIEQIKSAIAELNLSSDKKKICFINKCNRLNQASANALLKTLEEPPKNVIFLLSAETDNVISTIKSRCRIYRSHNEIVHTLSYDKVLTENLANSFNLIDEIVKEGQEKEFLAWLENYLEAELVKSQSNNIAGLMAEFFKIKKRISNNINLRLNFENIILKIRQEINE